MYALYVFTAYLVVVQAAVAGLLALPMGHGIKIGIVSWGAKQPWAPQLQYIVHAVALTEGAFLLFSAADQWKLSSQPATGDSAMSSTDALLLAQAQRDTFAAAFALFCLALIVTLFREVAAHYRLTLSHEALQKQAKNAGAHNASLMEEKEALEAEMKTLTAMIDGGGDDGGGTGAGAGAGGSDGGGGDDDDTRPAITAEKAQRGVRALVHGLQAVKAENAELKAEVRQKTAEVEAIKRQAKSNEDAYLRSMEHVDSLREQLRDVDAVMTSSMKKSD